MLAAVGLIGAQTLLTPAIACAHSPHDPIDALAVSPDFSADQTVFIASRDILLRSTDTGSSWKQLWKGLDHRTPFTGIAISPDFASNRLVLVATEADGIFRSTDAGESWTPVNDGLPGNEFSYLTAASHPELGTVFLAIGAEGDLYVSGDDGANWSDSNPPGDQVTTATALPDGGFWAGTAEGVILRSPDGVEWTEMGRLADAGEISVIEAPVGSSLDAVMVGTTRGGIYLSSDGGGSLTQSNQGLVDTAANDPEPDSISIQAVAFSPSFRSDQMVFAAGRDRAPFRSVDGGLTWSPTDVGVTCDNQAYNEPEYAGQPQFRDIAGSDALESDGVVFLAAWDGLFRSSDLGMTWVELQTQSLGYIKGLDVSPNEIDQATVALATYGGGAYLTDASATDWLVANQGLITTRLADMDFSPAFQSDGTIFSGAADRLLRTTDAGNSWQSLELRYETWRRSIVSALAKVNLPRGWLLTDLERARPYPNVIALSPDFPEDQTLFFGTRKHGVYRSTDGGTTADQMALIGESITDLVISPNYPEDGTVFAVVFEGPVFRSRDEGKSWSEVSDGLTLLEDWEAFPTYEDTPQKKLRLAISPEFASDRRVFLVSSQGLFQSSDGGDSWHLVETTSVGRNTFVETIAISPDFGSDGTLIIGVRGHGLYMSSDGGETFEPIGSQLLTGNHAIQHISFSEHFATDRTILAASDETLFISTDGGMSWREIARPIRYEDHRQTVHLAGDWEREDDPEASASSITTLRNGGYASLAFVGTGVTVIGERGPDLGRGTVLIDDQSYGEFDGYGTSREPRQALFSVSGLPYGQHVVVVEAVESLKVDAFDVAP